MKGQEGIDKNVTSREAVTLTKRTGEEVMIIKGIEKGQEDINIAAEEVVIITGTGRSQESINMFTAGAVVIIMQERTGDVNIINTGEIEN